MAPLPDFPPPRRHCFDGPSWPDCEGGNGAGQGFHWEVGWDARHMTFVAYLFDDWPDDEDYEAGAVLPSFNAVVDMWAGTRDLDILTMDELEYRLGVELPERIRRALMSDMADHFDGLLGEPGPEVRRRLHAMARGEWEEEAAGS